MTDQLRTLLRNEVELLEVPRPPVDAILADGRRRVKVRGTQRVVAVAACVALIAGGAIGFNRFLADDVRGPSPDVATEPPTPSPTPSATPSGTPVSGSVGVSGSAVGGQAFGTDEDTAVTAITTRLGVPDLVFGPREYSRIAGQEGWYDDPADTLSLSWQYRTMSASCWGQLCLIFGGEDADSLKLRGWELAVVSRWSDESVDTDTPAPDVRLAGTGIRLGDSWKRLHEAYPDTVPGGGEGSSLVVNNTPWPGIFDGVAEWRLSGFGTLPGRPTRLPARR